MVTDSLGDAVPHTGTDFSKLEDGVILGNRRREPLRPARRPGAFQSGNGGEKPGGKSCVPIEEDAHGFGAVAVGRFVGGTAFGGDEGVGIRSLQGEPALPCDIEKSLVIVARFHWAVL